tara:strand:- start:197 stop:1492 length:1296 start_codon:yes stop_codon:yes gene_type:complete
MSGFKADNKMSALDIFRHRSLYNGFAFSEAGEINIDPDATKNFWFVENMMHGRIREKAGQISIISPKMELLKNCKRSTGGAPALTLDFVSDAFEHMIVNHEKDRTQGIRLSDDSTYLSKLKVHAGAPNMSKKYMKSRAEFRRRFLSYCNSIKEETDRISSFESFVPFFMEYVAPVLEAFPVTRSSYMLSKSSSPMMSGLCLEISPLKHSKDGDKSKHFLNDPNFDIYRVIAAKSGFAIDKNAPWRLVADIASSQMLEFAAKRAPEISTAEDILDYYFEEVRDQHDELAEFQENMTSAYNLLISTNSVTYEKSVESDQKVILNKRTRTTEPHSSIVSRIGNNFWYEKFLTVKNIELSLGYDDSEIRKMANNASDLESSFDRSRATGYIKKRMTPILASEGSTTYRTSKIEGTMGDPKKDSQALARSLNFKNY